MHNRLTPQEIYNAIDTGAVSPIDHGPPPQRFDSSIIDKGYAALADIQTRIQELRERDFDYKIIKGDEVTLVKDTRGKPLNAINPHEEEIQALRHLAGMLLIAENTADPKKKSRLHERTKAYFGLYLYHLEHSPPADTTKRLVSEFTQVLEEVFPKTKGSEQLTMAKDLVILMETHPNVSTISLNPNEQGEENKKLSIEIANTVKISDEYYDRELWISKVVDDGKREISPWLQSALQYAGVQGEDNWLARFFSNNDNFELIKKNGITAPPSARWLPIPANNQEIIIYTADVADPNNGYEVRFSRFGTATAFDLKNVPEQKRLSIEQLKERVQHDVENARQRFFNNYQGLLPDDELKKAEFQFNYIHLLSPIPLERHLYPKHKDNNAAFVRMAKEAITQIAASPDVPKNVVFQHTNSPVNSMAFLAQEFAEDRVTRQHKIDATYQFLQKIFQKDNNLLERIFEKKEGELASLWGVKTQDDLTKVINAVKDTNNLKNASNSTRQEIIIRLQAAYHLQRLLDNKDPKYKNLSTYQRNIMMAALEFHVMGSQSCNIMGCKSARDRTAVLAAAIKTMQEDPKTMSDWSALNKGIMRSLEEGHNFRAMIYHTAIVKLSDVHKSFAKTFSKAAAIKDTKGFVKKPKDVVSPKTGSVGGEINLPGDVVASSSKEPRKKGKQKNMETKIKDYRSISQTPEQRLLNLRDGLHSLHQQMLITKKAGEKMFAHLDALSELNNPAKKKSIDEFLDDRTRVLSKRGESAVKKHDMPVPSSTSYKPVA